MMAFWTFIFWVGVGVAFAIATERLARRVRETCFGSILRQDMAFFDDKGHSVGFLTSLLSSSTEDLAGLSGPVIGGVLTFISTIITGVILAIIIGWKLALVCAACIPLVVICGWVRLQMLAIVDGKVRQAGQTSAAYASELVRSVRTVASLGMEAYALEQYEAMLARYATEALGSISMASALYAASQSVTFLCAALVFWYGGNLIADGEYTLFQFYICFVALISGSQIAATVFNFAPDASKAMHAAREIRDVINTKPHINGGEGGANMSAEKSGGFEVELRGVDVQYPSRPERLALKNIDMQIQPGLTIALVGPSGCGKSTIISVVERFYDPAAGTVRVNGRNIVEYDVREYRQHIALVSQEPFLFSGTVRENIVIGLPEQTVSDEDILEACQQANLHDFVLSLP